MQMPGRIYNSGDYRYGFNGKENDNEIKGNGNSLDFGARMYDPRLGRFIAMDPLAFSYPSSSTYDYAANNPIYYIDEHGENPGIPIIAAYEGAILLGTFALTSVVAWQMTTDVASPYYGMTIPEVRQGLEVEIFPAAGMPGGYMVLVYPSQTPVLEVEEIFPYEGDYTPEYFPAGQQSDALRIETFPAMKERGIQIDASSDIEALYHTSPFGELHEYHDIVPLNGVDYNVDFEAFVNISDGVLYLKDIAIVEESGDFTDLKLKNQAMGQMKKYINWWIEQAKTMGVTTIIAGYERIDKGSTANGRSIIMEVDVATGKATEIRKVKSIHEP
jgi:RHS repeat-associated protein